MNYVSKENMAEILDGIARKIGQGGSGVGLEDWQPSHEYTYNDICVHEGQIYRAKVGYTSDTNFNTTQILEEYTPTGEETIIPYEKDTEISIDDIVSYDNNTYKALYNFVCGEEFSLYALEEYVPVELTDDDIKEIVEAYNPVVEETKGIEYSTEERRIGTWIDGKPLYQRTFETTSPSAINTSADVVTLGNNIKIKNIDAIMDTASGTLLSLNHYVGANDSASIWKTSVTGNLRMSVSSTSYTSQPCYITIQYTKTTDGGGMT